MIYPATQAAPAASAVPRAHSIGHLHTRLAVAGDGAAAGPLRARLERLLAGDVLDAYAEALDAALGGDPAVYVVRRVDLRVTITGDLDRQPALARAWGQGMAGVVSRLLSEAVEVGDVGGEAGGDAGDPVGASVNVVRFADQAAYVAAFIAALGRGRAWERWYFGAFAPLRGLSFDAAARAALLDNRPHLPAILARLGRRPEALRGVLRRLSPETLALLWRDGARGGDAPSPADAARPILFAVIEWAERLGLWRDTPPSPEALAAAYFAEPRLPLDWRDAAALAGAFAGVARFGRARGWLRPWAGGAAFEAALRPLDWLDVGHLRRLLLDDAPAGAAGSPRQAALLRALSEALGRARLDATRPDSPANALRWLGALEPAWAEDEHARALIEAFLAAWARGEEALTQGREEEELTQRREEEELTQRAQRSKGREEEEEEELTPRAQRGEGREEEELTQRREEEELTQRAQRSKEREEEEEEELTPRAQRGEGREEEEEEEFTQRRKERKEEEGEGKETEESTLRISERRVGRMVDAAAGVEAAAGMDAGIDAATKTDVAAGVDAPNMDATGVDAAAGMDAARVDVAAGAGGEEGGGAQAARPSAHEAARQDAHEAARQDAHEAGRQDAHRAARQAGHEAAQQDAHGAGQQDAHGPARRAGREAAWPAARRVGGAAAEAGWFESECAGLFLLLRAMLDARLSALASFAEGVDPALVARLPAALALRWAGEGLDDDPGLLLFAGDVGRDYISPLPTDVGREEGGIQSRPTTDVGRDYISPLAAEEGGIQSRPTLPLQTALLRVLAGQRLVRGERMILHRLPLAGGRTALVAEAGDSGVWPFGQIGGTDAPPVVDAPPAWLDAWEAATGYRPAVAPAADSTRLAEALAALGAPATPFDLMAALAAAALLRLWARWLGRFADSGAPYLLAHFIRRGGLIHVGDHVVRVRLDRRPLDVVLSAAGYLSELERVDRLGGRRVRFGWREDV